MNSKIQLSIIVPVYNVEQYLEECLESVIKIEIKGTEIIVVDDGSTDNSNSIIKKYQEKDRRIRLIEQENAGNGAARNAGLEMASGEYILFLDSDDILFSEAIPLALDNARSNSSDMVVCDYFEFEDLLKPKYRYDRTNLPEGVIRDHKLILNKVLFFDISFSVWNKIYSRRFLENNSLRFQEGVWFEDLEFVFRAFFRAVVISKENSILIAYRQRKGSIMKTVSNKVLDKKTIVYEIKSYLESNEEMSIFRDGFKYMFFKMYISIIYQVLKNHGTTSIKKKILKQVFMDPYFFGDILSNSEVFKQISLSEKLLFIQIKLKILGLSTVPLYNALLKLERNN